MAKVTKRREGGIAAKTEIQAERMVLARDKIEDAPLVFEATGFHDGSRVLRVVVAYLSELTGEALVCVVLDRDATGARWRDEPVIAAMDPEELPAEDREPYLEAVKLAKKYADQLAASKPPATGIPNAEKVAAAIKCERPAMRAAEPSSDGTEVINTGKGRAGGVAGFRPEEMALRGAWHRVFGPKSADREVSH